MAKNIIQLNLQKSIMDVGMKNAQDCIKALLTYSYAPVKSISDIDIDDQSQLAAAIFNDNDRQEGYDALELDNPNSDVICKILAFLKNDNLDSRDDLCDAIKKSFNEYYQDAMSEMIDRAIQERRISIMKEHGLKPYIDNSTGETYYS